MRFVGSKWASCEPPGPASIVRPPVLETTCQSNGATTCSVKVAFRSGWSKQANIRLASAGSNCV